MKYLISFCGVVICGIVSEVLFNETLTYFQSLTLGLLFVIFFTVDKK